ncbi:Ig-like domain-containing protein [Jinshanibacter sp. LJY008]|uniref:Ig-like domain-containing protein n=1 Tax=Limnobaculum eriocheiris TaxID=2897391 RepID=A0A9X1MX06_9GAMM|nr:Ig-like domain-containing protein [Limnobaculum eriocheiris]MCD1125322.1 Ig-like domain-containing protein [Limnobaculum eriocheiris]
MDNANNSNASRNNEINILSRKGGSFISSVTIVSGTQTVTLTEPSIINIHGMATTVVRYERQGNDLIIHMMDGSIVICKDYFSEVNGTHSELVFTDDSQSVVHVTFPESQDAGVLIPEYQTMEDISPLYLVESNSGSFLPLGLGALAILGTGIAIASSNSKGLFHYDSSDGPQPTIPPVPTISPLFGNNLLNLVESQSGQTINGTTGITGTGQSVTVTIAGNNYVANVDDNGYWSLTLSPSILASLAQGEQSVSVVATNSAGQTGTISTTFLVDTIPPVVTVDSVTSDNIINLNESHGSIFITGTSEPGVFILVTYNNQQYTTTVDAQGVWSIELPPDTLSGMSNGIYTLTAVATDSAENSASASQSVTMALVPPTPTLNVPFNDDILNNNDVHQTQHLSGVTHSYGENQVVVVNIGGLNVDQHTVTQRDSNGKWSILVAPEAGGHTYVAQVDVNGNWELDLPPEVLQQLNNGTITITVAAADGLGNYGIAPQQDFYVDTIPPVLTLDPVAIDNIISGPESLNPLVITGSYSDLETGQPITLVLNNITYTTIADGSGLWSIEIPSADLRALSQGEIEIILSANDAANNNSTQTWPITVDTQIFLTVAPVAGDDIINAVEASSPVVVSGTADAADSGRTVTVTLEGINYTTTVQTGGSWSLSIPSADITVLADGSYNLSVNLTDAAGNSITVNHSITLTAAAADLPTLTLDPVSGDGFLNAAEATSPHVEEGQIVTLTLNGINYSATVAADGSWSTTVPVADLDNIVDGSYQVTAAVSDMAGNPASDNQPLVLITDSTNLPTLSVAPVTADDIISANESLGNVQVIGSSTNLQSGQIVTVTINDHNYFAVVGDGGDWGVTVPAADIRALSQGSVPLTASTQDIAGNPASVTDSFTVDTVVHLTVGVVAGDDIINAAEAAAPVVVSGTADVADSGQTVTVTLEGTDYTATVQSDGSWSLSIPSADLTALADGPYTLSASLTDTAGNSITVDHAITLSAGAANLPTLTLDPVSGDGYLNAAEATAPLTLSGTSTHVEQGQTVTLTLNGISYSATVAADGSWSTTVPVADLDNIVDGSYQVTAVVSDTAGNPASDNQPLVLITDSTNLPTLSVDPVTADDIVSATESQSDLTITGSSTHLQVGQSVTVTINNIDYTGTVGSGGTWSIIIPTADAQNLPQGSVAIAMSAEDVAGNPATSSGSFTVDTVVNLTVNTVAGDNIINALEVEAPLVISGTADVVDNGQIVTVTLEGTSYTTTVQTDGSWSLSIPSANVSVLADRSYTISASLTDAVGNTISVEHDITLDVRTNFPTMTIDAFTGDNYINAQEFTQPMTVTGTTHNVEEGQLVTINLNGQNYSGTVQKDGTWSLVVPAEDIGALLNQNYTVTGSVSNVVGNSIIIHGGLTVDTQIELTVNTVAGDDIIDNSEAASPVTISGTASADDVNMIVVVTLNGMGYTTTIQVGGTWSVNIPAEDIQALPDGPYTLTAAYTDQASNSISVDHNITIDASAPLTLTINDISDNNYINSTEINQDLVISGTSTGVAAGRTVTVTFNELNYTATVQSDGSWSLTVPALDVGATPDNVYVVSANVTNSSGTEVTAEHVVIVDTYIALTIEPITGDDIINAAELAGPVRIFGIASGDDVSSIITLTMGSFTYTINPNLSGAWSFNIPAADLQTLGNGSFTLHATMGDLSGNSIAIDHQFSINTSTPALAINPITGDDYINALEINSPINVTGTSVGIEAGQTVTITLNGVSYTAVVGGDGTWGTSIPAGDIQTLPDNTYSVTGSVSSLGGIEADTSWVLTFMTETVNHPTLSINSVTADNILSASEMTTDLIITGSSTNIHPGLNILVTLNGDTYSGQAGSNGSWQIAVPVAALEALPQGSMALEVTAQDIAGNSVTQNGNFTVDTGAARLSTLFSLMTTEQNIDSYQSHDDPKVTDENMTTSVTGINSLAFNNPLIDLIEPAQNSSQTNHSVNNANPEGLQSHLSESSEDKGGQHSALLISTEDEDSGYITLFNTPEEIRNASAQPVQVQHAVESQPFDVYHNVSLGLEHTLVQENIYM